MNCASQRKPIVRLVTLGLTLLLAGTQACASYMLDEPIVGGHILVASDGYVTAEFLGSDAGYFNSVYFESPADGSVFLFDKSSPVDASTSVLGWFAANTELTFRLDVTNTGDQFFTGSADGNPDGIAHAMAITQLQSDGAYSTDVGFEDLLGGGDLDYNDFMFRLANVVDPLSVPLPSGLALFALGLASMGGVRRRRR